ncbi:MAG: tRNA adenosine(34) deaminase TadA [Terriglobia bacterium]
MVVVRRQGHERYMRLALRQAERALIEDEVPVGAVVVRDGKVLARAHNRPLHLHDPTAHAEILALRSAARKTANYRLNGCCLYVTIEPCAMCAGAIIQARLEMVVVGARDLKAGACGSALEVLNHPKLNHRVKLVDGILADETISLLRRFFLARREKKTSSGFSER